MTLELSETIECEDGRKITVNVGEKEIGIFETSDVGTDLPTPSITISRGDFSKIIEQIRRFNTAQNAMISSGPNIAVGSDPIDGGGNLV